MKREDFVNDLNRFNAGGTISVVKEAGIDDSNITFYSTVNDPIMELTLACEMLEHVIKKNRNAFTASRREIEMTLKQVVQSTIEEALEEETDEEI